MQIHVHHHHDGNADHIARRLEYAINLLEKLMATIDQVVQDVADESTAIDSVSTLVAGLKQQLADALSGANIPPAVQAKIDSVFAGLEANKAKLASALTTDNGSPQPAAPTT